MALKTFFHLLTGLGMSLVKQCVAALLNIGQWHTSKVSPLLKACTVANLIKL